MIHETDLAQTVKTNELFSPAVLASQVLSTKIRMPVIWPLENKNRIEKS